ncbi:MAG: formimidoylglutamate deiminase, partial [Longimicrobiales bacterium]
LDAGRIAPGALADLVAIDLEHAVLAGWTEDTLAASLALCAGAEVVTDVWIGGRARVSDGRHDHEEATLSAFRDVARRL